MSIELQPKYKNFLQHTGRYSIVTGGRGSGKSFTLALLAVLLSYEKGQRILYTRYTMASARKSIIPELQEKIELLDKLSDFKITKDEIINLRTKSSIIFMGIKSSNGINTARLKSLKGITTLIVDEAEELVDEKLFEKINDSIRVKGIQNRVILMLNPASKTHWIYERFFEKKGVREGYTGIVNDTCYIHSTFLDNLENLDEDKVREWRASSTENPAYYEHVIMGGWLDKSEGVIYKNWQYGKFPDDVETYFGADWGFSRDQTALVEVHIDRANKKIYLKEHYYKTEATMKDILTSFRKVVGDRLIVADYASGGDRIIAELKNAGFNIHKADKGAGSLKEGIKLIQDYTLVIEEQSINLIRELNEYCWDKRGEPTDLYNHLLDAARYIITDRIKPKASGIYHFY